MFKITNNTHGEIHETTSKAVVKRIISDFLAEGSDFSVTQSYAYRVEIFDCETGKTDYVFFDTKKQAERYVRWYGKEFPYENTIVEAKENA